MPYLPAASNCRQLACTDVVVWSHTTVPVAFRLQFLCICTNLEVQERYLPIIRGAERLSLAEEDRATATGDVHSNATGRIADSAPGTPGMTGSYRTRHNHYDAAGALACA